MKKIVKIIKIIKIKNIVILILILAFNTYAWFIYATRVSSSLTVHISSWNVQFSIGEEETVTNILIEVERIFPGMEPFEKHIEVKNKGEIKAILDYEIKSLKVMDEFYEIADDMSSEDLENKMKTDYPFEINVASNDTELAAGTGTGSFTITVNWPFESGDDELDTLWGNKAYEFYSLNPDAKSIEIGLTLIAQQIAQ